MQRRSQIQEKENAFSGWSTQGSQNEVFYIMHSAAENLGKLKGVEIELTTKKKSQKLIAKSTTATCQASVRVSCDARGLKRECSDDDKEHRGERSCENTTHELISAAQRSQDV